MGGSSPPMTGDGARCSRHHWPGAKIRNSLTSPLWEGRQNRAAIFRVGVTSCTASPHPKFASQISEVNLTSSEIRPQPHAERLRVVEEQVGVEARGRRCEIFAGLVRVVGHVLHVG